MQRLLFLLLISCVVWSTEMTTFNLPCAANGRAQVAQALIGAKARTSDVVASVNATVAKWSLTNLDASTFGFLASVDGNNYVSITSGARVLTSPNNCWTAADVGKTIYIQGAGVGGSTLVAVIGGYTSPGNVTITANAGTTVAASQSSASGIALWGYVATTISETSPLTNVDGTLAYTRGSQYDAVSPPFLNVKSFGAVGDGVTNDTTALNLAFSTALSTTYGAGVVYFPRGVYLTSGISVTMDNASITVLGEGQDCTIIRKTGASTDPVLRFTITAAANKQVVVDNVEIDANNVASVDGLVLEKINNAKIINVRSWKARNAVSGIGCLLSDFDRVRASNSQNGFIFTYDAPTTVYANVINLRNCVSTGNTTWGLDYGKGAGLNVDGCDFETNGTAADVNTGGLIIRNTIDDEFGFGAVSVNNSWFESNLGRSISIENASGGVVRLNNVQVYAPESNRSLNAAAGLRFLSLNGFIAPSTNDTVTVAAENFTADDCFIHTLTNNATNYALRNVKTSVLDALTTIKTSTAGSDINIGTNVVTAKNTPKAIAKFDGTSASPTAVFNHNIAGITKNGTGDYTVAYTNSISNQAVLVTALKIGSGACAARFISSGAGSYRFLVVNMADVAVDADEITVTTYGN